MSQTWDARLIWVKEQHGKLLALYWLPIQHKRKYKARFLVNPSSDTTILILYDILFYFIYIAPGPKVTTLRDNGFDGSRKVLSLRSLVACFK